MLIGLINTFFMLKNYNKPVNYYLKPKSLASVMHQLLFQLQA